MNKQVRKLLKEAGVWREFVVMMILRSPFDICNSILTANMMQKFMRLIEQNQSENLGKTLAVFFVLTVLLFGYNMTIWSTIAVRFTVKLQKTLREKMGVVLDPWQDQVGSLILARREDGWLASTIDGIGMSLPRQVGKTYLVASLTFALCVNTPGLLVIWTAQHSGTSDETFLSLQGFARRSQIKAHVRKIYTGSGDEEVRFHNGSRILFGAREQGFGRGFDQVDVLVLDEGQILTESAMTDMVPATNAAPNGLVIIMGTPPRPKDPGEVFAARRQDGLDGDPDTLYVELSADRGAKIIDHLLNQHFFDINVKA